jgi:hypothetical protein
MINIIPVTSHLKYNKSKARETSIRVLERYPKSTMFYIAILKRMR